MAGFLGGSSGSGTGGEIQFPAEFIDPVTKLRVSEPETLIDTDFEYGLQPTKWETVELINNTPSFFSKSGDTTINGILSMVTTATSREVKVTTQDNHGLAVGIPINVSGTKSITADGSYIINSIPDPKSFTYLAKQNQDFTASIFDLYTSIITGEFFQGSQIKISDSQGIVTNAGSPSALTVQTDSPHGFQVGTPFYFLNLNSTVSQQFDASNTGAKTFDSSNSATAQNFDGSNTLTTYSVDLQNKASIGGATSATQTHSTANKTITVLHTTEGFAGRKVGTPLYYNVIAASGYFNTYPRGIVYLASNGFNVLGASATTSTFSVSSVPGGAVLDIPSFPNGTFQIANNASLFAGNNTDSIDQVVLPVSLGVDITFDGTNTAGSLSTVNTYSGTIIQLNNDAGTTISPGLYDKAMVLYTTTGTAASGLTNNTTYFVTYYNEPAGASVPGFFQIKVATLPGGADITVSGGTGTQKFRKIGVSTDKDILHVPFHGFTSGDMVKYTYPSGGAVTMTNRTSDYVYVGTVYDTYNITLDLVPGIAATGGTITTITDGGQAYKVHTFTTVGTSTFTITQGSGEVQYLVIGGGGGGGGWGGGGGAGGYRTNVTGAISGGNSAAEAALTLGPGAYTVVVGDGGAPGTSAYTGGGNGGVSTFHTITSQGGGGGGWYNNNPGYNGASGGGGGIREDSTGLNGGGAAGTGITGQGFAGGRGSGRSSYGVINNDYGGGGGGGGAGAAGGDCTNNGSRGGVGGNGLSSTINGTATVRAGGGGGHSPRSDYGIAAGGTGGGANGGSYYGSIPATAATPNTGSGGGGNWGGDAQRAITAGATGIVIIRYKA